MTCTFDPVPLKEPLGMFPCPDCDAMLVAGLPHPPPDTAPAQDYIPPTQGGCWFCWRTDGGDDLVFDVEWDTHVHRSCILAELDLNPDHPEARDMRYLLPED